MHENIVVLVTSTSCHTETKIKIQALVEILTLILKIK